MDLKTRRTVMEMSAVVGVYVFLMEVLSLIVLKEFRPEVAAGLLAGGIAACLMAIHLAGAISLSLELHEADGRKHMALSYIKRWGLLILLFIFSYYMDFLSLPAVFLGVFGLKAGAYGQPLMHKLFKHMEG